MLLFVSSGSNAEEYSKIENVQNTSVDYKKGEKELVQRYLNAFYFINPKKLRNGLVALLRSFEGLCSITQLYPDYLLGSFILGWRLNVWC